MHCRNLIHLCAPLLLVAGPVMAAAGHGEAAAHGHEGGGSGGGLPQFDPTWFASQIFWLVLLFVVLYVFFSRKTLPEISGVLESRGGRIQGDLDAADRLAGEADAVRNAYENSLEKARVEAAGVIADVESALAVKTSRAMESFAERSERSMTATEARIRKARIDAQRLIDEVIAEVAVEAASKIVGGGTGFSANDALDVVEKFAKEERAKAV